MNKPKLGKLFFLVILFVCGGILAAGVSPLSVTGAKTVNASEAKTLFDRGALFVDVRKDSDWEAGRVPDAMHLELNKVFTKESLSAELKFDAPVVFYCNGEQCLRSSEASALAVDWGFKNVYFFRDGFPAWKSAGYPIE